MFLREHLFELELDALPAARRPDAVPRRARRPLQPLQGRGRVAGDATWPTAAAAEPRCRPATTKREAADAARCRRRSSWPRAYARYQELMASAGRIDFGDQVSPRAAAAARAPGRAPGSRPALPLRPGRRVPGHEPRAVGAGERCSPAADRNVTVVGDDDQAIYRFRGAAIRTSSASATRIPRCRDGRPPPQLPLARADPRRRAPPDPATTTPSASRSRGRRQASRRRSGGRSPRRSEQPARSPRRRGGRRVAGRDRRGAVAAALRPARPRRAGARERRGRADPAQPERGRGAWRFSGAPGCTRGRRCGSCLGVPAGRSPTRSVTADLYALAAVGPVRLLGDRPDGRRRAPGGRPASLWDVLEELERAARVGWPGARRRDAARPRSSPTSGASSPLRTSDRPGRSSTASCTTAGSSPRSPRQAPPKGRGGAAQRGPLLRTRPRPVGRSSPTPASVFSCPPADADRGGRRPGERGARSRRGRGAVLTVHRAKGLEFPVVFMVGLVDGRFPVAGRRERLALPDGLVAGRRRPDRRRPHARRSGGCSTSG